ncbi:MAG TPA: phage tail tape measure C-terminal domain-containing protein [Amaricoccus sp.]|nr:phage tail tape measure C-terminal domain-containing protein [Amaricoccus sp.]
MVGGREVRAELEGVGEAGNRGFGRLSREMEAANARLAGFSRAAKLAVAAAAGAFLAGAGAMIRSSLELVDSQAKMAQSLRTTVESVQVLTWAGELAGVSLGEIEQATKKLTTRLSEAAQGSGSAVEALARLNLTAVDLQRLPLDQRIIAIQRALATYVPEAQRAAVASDLFGDRAGLAFLRIDTATLEEATRDVRDFGVAVSDGDARQIERTGDAIARLGLIWRGLSNQLAVAAAPALEAVANAMATLARATGPLGIAIRSLFDNIGRFTAYAATFAGIMAGRWVAGLVAAAVSVRGLATALVVLRGALIRTGIGVLIVAAVYQFGRLVAGAGGFGEALSLLGDVAAEVWERIKLGGRSLALSLKSVWATIEAGWLTALSGIQRSWADFLHAATRSLDGVPGMESTMLTLSEAAIRAGSAFYETSVAAGEASARADGLAASAAAAAGAATGPLASLQSLRDAVKGAGEEAETALGSAAIAAEDLGDAVGKAGGASAAAAPQVAEAPEAATTGWQLATDAVRDYADKARETGQGIGDALVSGFRGAEDAVGEFVRTGKLGMRDLVTSILADLAKVSVRRFVLAPIANALGGVLGSLGPAFAGVLHAGGMVGVHAPERLVPALAFAGAPRMHSGGVAGLHPDEVPAILKRGERVLSRAETRAFDRAQSGAGVTINIMTTDAESFRRSRTQVASDIARAVAFGRRGM